MARAGSLQPRPRYDFLMRIGSLFSGAGGLDRAVESVFGAELAWFSEIDPAASKVLAYRFPGVPNLGSVTEIDWAAVEPVDIVCGGWPCQPFSLAGKRKGINDERALWPHVAGAIRVLRPRFVVLENVSAVLTAGEFDRVAADLASCGYGIRWTCARASDVGAPHRRERLFVVAHAQGDGWDEGRPEPAWLVGGFDAAVRGDGAVDLLPTPSCADGGGGHLTRSGARGDELLLPGVARAYATGDLLPTPAARDWKGSDSRSDHERHSPGLDAITYHLPTPAAADGHRGPDFARAQRDGSGGDDLHTIMARLLPTHA